MRSHPDAGMSLYGPTGGRKYLNAAERQRFVEAARTGIPRSPPVLFHAALERSAAYRKCWR